MLRAEELMVGDWVYAIDANGEKHPCRANNLEYDYTNKRGDFCVDFYGTGYEAKWPDVAFNVEHIPITPEILEKNGFVKDKEEDPLGTTYHILIPTGYEANSYTIQITLYTEPICGVSVLLKIWGRIPPYNGGINDIHLCGAKYVHELQHALRLCGINKTIEL